MILGRGAEAIVEKAGSHVKKTRPIKSYRHPDLDKRLRQFRTRREATVLNKLPVSAPKLFSVDDKDMVLEMEFLDGKQLRDVLSIDNYVRFMRELAVMIKTLHEHGMVHGDLTTSNIMVVDDVLYLIDFGLSQFSDHVEEYAVDLHLLKHAFEAKHPDLDLWEAFWDVYDAGDELVERFMQVEARGRYKGKNA